MSLPRGFIQYDAGRDARIQRLDSWRMRNHYQFIHFPEQLFINSGAFIAHEDCRSAAQVGILQGNSLMR